MNLRFVEYENEIYIVLGITYDARYSSPECFTIIPLDKYDKSVYKAVLIGKSSITVPTYKVKEITDKNRLIALMLLYGWLWTIK